MLLMQAEFVTEEKLLKVIELVLNDFSENTFSDVTSIISGKDRWQPSKSSVFENSFAENIVKRLSYLEDPIGWEVDYPSDVFSGWSTAKLDLAYGHIDKHYFDSVVEVKRWNGDDSIQYYVWEDIFKIYGYKTLNYKNAGNNKYVITLYTGPRMLKEEICDLFKNYFVNPNIGSLNYDAHDITGAFKNLLSDFNWAQDNIDQLFSEYGQTFSNIPFIEFKDEYLLHDLEEDVFALLLKLKS